MDVKLELDRGLLFIYVDNYPLLPVRFHRMDPPKTRKEIDKVLEEDKDRFKDINKVRKEIYKKLWELYRDISGKEKKEKESEESIEEELLDLVEIDREIRKQFNGDVSAWVKSKLDLYIVGEDKNKQLVFHVMASKDLDDPIHASVEGGSGIGKTTLVSRILKCFPEDQVIVLSRFTPAYLDYVKDRLKHKILLIQQLTGAESGQDTLHVMMTEKGLRLGTVKRGEGGTYEVYYVEAEGPLSFITTTIKSVKLDEQFRTRVWRIYLDDSPEQTMKIQEFNNLLAREPWREDEIKEELRKIQLYMKFLSKYGVKDILIPYSDKIKLSGRSVRIRRDHLKLLNLIKVIAYVNQFYNHYIVNVDGKQYVVANKKDLEKALEIAGESLKQTVLDLPKAADDILKICREISADKDSVITAREVAKRSGGRYSQATARNYLNYLVDTGFLYKIEEGGGRGRATVYELAEKDLEKALDIEALQKNVGEITPEYLEEIYGDRALLIDKFTEGLLEYLQFYGFTVFSDSEENPKYSIKTVNFGLQEFLSNKEISDINCYKPKITENIEYFDSEQKTVKTVKPKNQKKNMEEDTSTISNISRPTGSNILEDVRSISKNRDIPEEILEYFEPGYDPYVVRCRLCGHYFGLNKIDLEEHVRYHQDYEAYEGDEDEPINLG
ncbi:hypothetical protein DRN87_04395 [Candidatus Geothermarchaeota archaeon]|nr:MAG: hypothetical protein DRN87_04395 [Candidatus Geothermarchaeota archaeon]